MDDKIVAGSGTPIFGAIFMCNRETKKECLKRKLFGLPPSQANFVKKVKTGMVLFLFEYEERKLYGVFQATSDGSMNIVPHAFMSSGKKIPAQILFKTIWHCKPLFEQDFRVVIKDNYYTSQKFNYGLSQNQVYKLLCLFNSRKVGTPKAQNLFQVEQPKNLFGNSNMGRLSVSEDEKFINSEARGNKYGRDKDLRKYLGLSRSNQSLEIPRREMDNQHGNSPYQNIYSSKLSSFQLGSSSFGGMDGKKPKNTPGPCSKSSSGSQVFPCDENLNLSSMKRPSLDTEDYIPLTSLDPSESNDDYIPLALDDQYVSPRSSVLMQETLCPRNQSLLSSNENHESSYLRRVPSDLETCKGLSFLESSVTTLPFSMDVGCGRENISSSMNPGIGLTCAPDHRYPISHHGYGFEGPQYSDYELSNATVCLGESNTSLRKSYTSAGIYPLDSHSDFYEGTGKDSKDHDNNGVKMILHSDIQKKRTSVFSRLSTIQKANEPDGESVNQLMCALYQSDKHCRGSTKKPEHHMFFGFENTQMKFEVTAVATEEQQDINDEKIEVPINFKRRSEIQKVQGQMGGCSEESTSQSCKRRKLVRPNFVIGENDLNDNLQKVIEPKGNLESGENSDGTGSTETGVVVGADNAKLEDVSVTQELVGVKTDLVNTEGPSEDAKVICCQSDSGPREAVDSFVKSQFAALKEAVNMSVKREDIRKTKEAYGKTECESGMELRQGVSSVFEKFGKANGLFTGSHAHREAVVDYDEADGNAEESFGKAMVCSESGSGQPD